MMDYSSLTDGIREFVARHVVPLVAIEDGQRVVYGTANLFRISKLNFLITAEHVANRWKNDRLYVPVDPHGEELRNPPGRIVVWKPPGPDVGLFELKEDPGLAFPSKDFLSLDHVQPFPTNLQRKPVWIVGFPSIVTERFELDWPCHPAVFKTEFYEGNTDVITPPVRRLYDLLFQHAATGIDPHTGEEKPSVPLEGMSGSAVWLMHTVPLGSTVWTPEGGLRIIGLQTAYHRGRWIRCCNWNAVLSVLHRTYPEIRDELEDRFGPPNPEVGVWIPESA